MRVLLLLALVVGCGNGQRTVEPEAPIAPRAAAPAPAPTFDEGLFPQAVLVEGVGAVVALASDDSHIYWLDDGGGLYRAPANGGAPERIGQYPGAEHMVLGGDTAYVADGTQLHAVALATEEARALAEVGYVAQLAVSATHVFAAADAGLIAIERSSGQTTVLVPELPYVSGLATDGTYVYWVEPGDPGVEAGGNCIARGPDGAMAPCEPSPPVPGSIRRVPIAGGAEQVIAAEQLLPSSIAIVGRWVYWTTEENGAVLRAPNDGGDVQRLLGGGATHLAADAWGAATITAMSLVVELSGQGGPPRVRSVRGELHSFMTLTKHAMVVDDPWNERIVAYPRGPSRVEIIASPRTRLVDIALSDDYLYYLDVHHRADDRVLRVPRAGGAIEVVHRQKGSPMQLAVAGDVVVTADPYFNRIAIGARTVETTNAPLGVATDGANVYWVEYDVLQAMPVAGGDRRELFVPEFGMFSSGGPPPATVIAARGEVWAVGGMLPGLVRYVDGDEAELSETSALVADAGDGVVVFDQDRGLLKLPGDQVLMAAGTDNWPSLIAANSREALALMYLEEGMAIVRYPFDGGASEALPIELPLVRMLADDDAVYLGTAQAVIRVALDVAEPGSARQSTKDN